uniref:Ion_trans_2 domain-containing protein n=1 Tax=Steinernema glaseri TaxID=37863 RepID=A0A1I7Z8K9_9BILA
MLRSLSRRGSSLFGSQSYLRLQSTDPAELRATERFLRSCSFSDFSSVAPSVSWQNRANTVRQAFLRFFRLPKSVLLRLLITFVVVWLLSSAIIRPIERSHQVATQDEEDNKLYALRLQFLQRFSRMDYYIPMSNPEWEESTRYLIGWYQQQLVNLTSTEWTFPYAFAFAYFTGSGSSIPGTLQQRLSDSSKGLLVLWFPVAVFLHFTAIFTFVNCIRRISTFRRYLVVTSASKAWLLYRYMQSSHSLSMEMLHHFLRLALALFVLFEFLSFRGKIHRRILLYWSIDDLRRRYGETDHKFLIQDYATF